MKKDKFSKDLENKFGFFVFYSVYGRPRTFLTHPTPSIDLPPWSYPTMEKKFCDFWVATSFLSSKTFLLKKSTFFLLLLSSLHRFSKRKVLKEERVCVFYSLTLRLFEKAQRVKILGQN